MKTTLSLFFLLLVPFLSRTQELKGFTQHDLLFIPRDAFRQILFKSAEDVVVKTKDPEAAKVFNFVQKHHALGIMSSNGTALLEKANANTSIALIPLMPGDYQDIKPQVRIAFEGHRLAFCYTISNRTVIGIRCDYKLSPFSQGTTLLHEGMHALINHERGRGGETLEEGLADEVQVRKFENRLHKLYGKEAYEKVVMDEMNTITNEFAKEKVKIGDVFPYPTPYNTGLDVALGKAESNDDRNGRRTTLIIDITFRLLEQEYKGKELQELKQKYVQSIFDKSKRDE